MSQEAAKILMWSEEGTPRVVRWFAWEILQIDGDALTQAGDFAFINKAGQKFAFPAQTTAKAIYPEYPASIYWFSTEAPLNLLDRSPSTKFCNQFHFSDKGAFMIGFDMQSECLDLKTYNRYQWWTANDSVTYKRNPTSWRVLVSNDGQTWYVIDEVNDNPSPTSNLALAYTSKELR